MISHLAVVETECIGSNVKIGEFSIVRPAVVIGDNVTIHSRVVIESGITIGSGVEIFPGTLLGKTPKGAGVTSRPISYVPRVVIGDGCALGPNAVVYYDVEIGNSTLLGDGASLREQVRVGHHCLLGRYVTVNYNVNIGHHTKIMDLTHITGNCRIGSNVFVSVLVSTTNDNLVVTREYRGDHNIGPQIEDEAVIGAGASILPGVRIGRGAFVGANAVVTRDVNPYTMVVGVPARVVRKLREEAAE